MRHGSCRWGLALVLVLAVAYSALAASDVASATTIPIAGPAVRKPRTDGETVVWAQLRAPAPRGEASAFWDVYGADLRTGRVFPVATGPERSRSDPVVMGGIVVWAESSAACPICNRDILALDLATGRRFVVAATEADETRPAIAGSLVAWVSDDGSEQRLLANDLHRRRPPITLAHHHSPETRPELAGDRLVWVETITDPVERFRVISSRLLTARVSATGVIGEVTAIAEVNPGLGAPTFGVAGDLIAYASSYVPYAHDLRTGTTTTLTGIGGLAIHATTDGRYVFWGVSGRMAVPGLAAYDLATDSAFHVPGDPAAWDGFPHLAAGILVWQRDPRAVGATHTPTIQAARVADVLPSARRPAPTVSSPERTYFPEVGHTLASGFRALWERSGGLPVFGFPVTEEFSQHNADTGRMHIVQYVERQRFEYHPELAGTAYETQLGRLGAEDATHRDLTGTWAFQPVLTDAAHPAGCRYIAEARHRLCGEFRPYWESHGLELGDPGVSFREALALFGYPISEEFIDPDSGLITQYFERAVFEYHAGNPLPNRVLLRRLGAERLAGFGW